MAGAPCSPAITVHFTSLQLLFELVFAFRTDLQALQVASYANLAACHLKMAEESHTGANQKDVFSVLRQAVEAADEVLAVDVASKALWLPFPPCPLVP